MPVRFDIRIERWNLGVQWFSFNWSGHARVRLDATTDVDFLADYGELPPALVIAPEVKHAKAELLVFEVERISKVGGDVAEGVGDAVGEVLEKVWLERENDRLDGRLNREIQKHRQDLRWSLTDWWQRLSGG